MSETKHNPKRRSEEYHNEQAAQPEQEKAQTPEPKRTPQQWESLVNQRIEEAMQRGAFDNLRNKGKPLDPSPEPYVPPDMQMANSLLKNNELTPAWISDRAAVLAGIEHFRAKLLRAAADFAQERAEAATPQRLTELDDLWGRYVESWRAEIVEINKHILTQNLKQPVTFLEIYPLRLEDEVRRARE